MTAQSAGAPDTAQGDNVAGRYCIIIAGEKEPEKVSERVNIGSLSGSKKKKIENLCKVSLTVDNDKGEITISPGRNTQRDGIYHPEIAYQILTDLLAKKASHSVTERELHHFFDAHKPRNAKPSRPDRRRQKGTAKRITAPTASAPVPAETIQPRVVTIPALVPFLRLLAHHDRARALEVFSNDPRIGIKIELHRKDDNPKTPPTGLKAYMPVYADGSSREDKLQIALAVLSTLSQTIKNTNQSITTEIIAQTLDAELDRRTAEREAIADARRRAETAEAALQSVKKEKKTGEAYKFKLPVKILNGKPVQDFAAYMVSDNRRTAMVPFREHDDLPFEIRVIGDKNQECYFEIVSDERDRRFDETSLTLAKFLLARLREAWQDGRNIRKAFVEQFLEDTLHDIKTHHTQETLGDKLTIIFANMAARERISLSFSTPEEPETRADGQAAPEADEKPSSLSLATAVFTEGGDYRPPVQFDLAPWEEDEKGPFIRHVDELGKEQKIYPTPNQLKYIAALRNNDVRSILLHGETGTGKTFWATRVALEMLQQGAIRTFFYERATATVGRRQYNPYRKGGDTSMFSNVLEDGIATHLGQGDIDKGEDIFNSLSRVGMVKRYDQMYRRGDNLDNAFLLLDEAQDKDDEEVFHIISRPKDNGKVALIGDYKRQNDLGDMSGFAREFAIHSNPEVNREVTRRLKAMGRDPAEGSIVTMTFGVEDISRSNYTARLVMAHDVYDEMFGERQRPNYGRRRAADSPHPSDRYDNPPVRP